MAVRLYVRFPAGLRAQEKGKGLEINLSWDEALGVENKNVPLPVAYRQSNPLKFKFEDLCNVRADFIVRFSHRLDGLRGKAVISE